jgi:hypothetical protein
LFANFDFKIEKLTAITSAAATFAVSAVPEPSSAALLMVATAVLGGAARKRRSA